jgi:hypothetical protein
MRRFPDDVVERNLFYEVKEKEVTEVSTNYLLSNFGDHMQWVSYKIHISVFSN